MSEIRMQEVVLTGRMKGDPKTVGDKVYFLFEADENEPPFRCFCEGKTAENMKRHLRSGDEFTVEGKLRWVRFREQRPEMIVEARYTSYGRKARTL